MGPAGVEGDTDDDDGRGTAVDPPAVGVADTGADTPAEPEARPGGVAVPARTGWPERVADARNPAATGF
jgi:hypothetical protein